MKKIANLLAGACAVLLCAAAPAFAETEENDPAEDDVVMWTQAPVSSTWNIRFLVLRKISKVGVYPTFG